MVQSKVSLRESRLGAGDSPLGLLHSRIRCISLLNSMIVVLLCHTSFLIQVCGTLEIDYCERLTGLRGGETSYSLVEASFGRVNLLLVVDEPDMAELTASRSGVPHRDLAHATICTANLADLIDDAGGLESKVRLPEWSQRK